MVGQDAYHTVTGHFLHRGGSSQNAHHIFLGDMLLIGNLVMETPAVVEDFVKMKLEDKHFWFCWLRK